MKTFTRDMKLCAQGDTIYEYVDSIPADATPVVHKDGPLIAAHSETGHHHQFNNGANVQMFTTPDPFVCYLRMETPEMLEHLREFDTHEAIMFADAGCVRMRRQREHTPEGYRMVAD